MLPMIKGLGSGLVLLLLGAASCARDQQCDRNEDCPAGFFCVGGLRSCIEFGKADLSGAAEDLRAAPGDDLASGGDGGGVDGGARPKWTTGMAAAGTLDGPFAGPAGACWSGTRLYVSDSGHHRVLVYDTVADKAKPIGAIGRADLKVSTTPVSPPTAKSLNHPAGLWCDADTLLVADRDNNRVLVFTGMPGSGTAADAVVGQASLTSGDANRKGATAANSLAGPEDVFWDGERLYVADSGNNRVVGYAAATAMKLRELAPAGAEVVLGQKALTDKTVPTSATDSALGRAAGVAVSEGRVAVVDSAFHRALLYDAPAGFTPGTALKADAALGQVNLTNKNAGVGPTKFTTPVTLRPGDGEYYAVDGANNRVLIYEGALPAAGEFATAAKVALGQPKIGAPGTPGNGPADLKGPAGVALASPGGSIFLVVSDAGNDRVQLFKGR